MAVNIITDLRKLCAMGGFHLTKFISSSIEVLSAIPVTDRSKQAKTLDLVKDCLPPERALGIFWHIDDDTFGFNVDVQRITTVPRTRRGILSAIASLYDPFGLASP